MASTTAIDLGQVSQTLGLAAARVQTVVDLLDAGNTVPFITRYRKDQTGGMDEEQIREVQSRVLKLRLLAERKQTILRSIDSQGKLTAELAAEIAAADTPRRLEDLYLPYKPRKQTLATIARDRGLEPLADEILKASPACADLDARAADFISVDRKVATAADALLGAGHILAEWFSERADLRGKLRAIFERTGKLVSTRLEPEPKEKEAAEKKGTTTVADSPSSEAATSEPAPQAGCEPRETQLPLFPDVPAAEEEIVATPQAEPTRAPPSEMSSGEMSSGETSSGEMSSGEMSSGAVPASEIPCEMPSGITPSGEIAAHDGPSNGAAASHSSPGDRSPGDTPPSQASADLPTPGNTATEQAGQLAVAEARPVATALPAKKKGKAAKKAAKAARTQNDDDKAFRDYFQYSEAINKAPPHRVLAINRGERAKVLRVRIDADVDAMHKLVDELLVPVDHPHADFLRGCARDALTRLILPSLEREVRRELTDRAELHAVEVFARNLRNLLLQPPVRDARVLAIDPGFKSGCKIVAIDEFGNLLDHGVAHIVGSEERRAEGKRKAVEMVRQHQLKVVAIGNGTGCRAAEQWVSDLIAGELADANVAYVVVNEAGASVYSTSRVGREELPKYDATARGA
ncbi:MAG TPA: Tex-like N-terminal domain-containing protein, partial [Pirellulales bacterium]|nr:Tex-like N-terminal domain-containing protein [Pirellulales bacterium]